MIDNSMVNAIHRVCFNLLRPLKPGGRRDFKKSVDVGCIIEFNLRKLRLL